MNRCGSPRQDVRISLVNAPIGADRARRNLGQRSRCRPHHGITARGVEVPLRMTWSRSPLPVEKVRHLACQGGSRASVLPNSPSFLSSAEAREPLGQAQVARNSTSSWRAWLPAVHTTISANVPLTSPSIATVAPLAMSGKLLGNRSSPWSNRGSVESFNLPSPSAST